MIYIDRPWQLVKRAASGAARGMAYLHGGNPPVLHRDLKSVRPYGFFMLFLFSFHDNIAGFLTTLVLSSLF
jgi:hypothetical protein